MQDFSEYLDFTKQLALNSGKILSKHFGNIKSINKKSTNIDLVAMSDASPLYAEIMPSLEAANRRAEIFIQY